MTSRPRSKRAVVMVSFLVALLSSACTRAGAAPVAGKRLAGGGAALAEIDRLVAEEQKLETAHEKAVALIAEARKAGDQELLTRALVKAVQLRTGLDGYETAVEFLRAEEWPQSPEQRAILDLFYGQALVHYQMAYSWEIQQRERVVGTEVVDLKQWTSAQIAQEAVAAFVRAWSLRESLGALPVKAWSEFLQVNNYPAQVRGTLRDAVTYLLAEVLGDTSLWTPEQSNAVWRLNLDELLAERPPAVDLGGPEVHPLSKQALVLADLQNWHRGDGRRDAELEARLMRARFLHQSVSDAADKRKIREHLASWLPAYRKASWWSYGMATLASLVREADDDPDALARARQIALDGIAGHPGSPGAVAGRRIVEEIEARDFQVTSMASDSPRRRSLQVVHKNLPALYFRAYRFDLLASLEGSTEPPMHRRVDQLRRGLLQSKAEAAWTTALPSTPDYRQHTTYVEPPLDRLGAYMILVSAREDFAERNNRMLLVTLVLGDLVLAPRGVEDGVQVVLALDGRTGAPLPGAVLKLFRHDWQHGHRVEATATAGADGVVRLPRKPNQSYFVFGAKGDSVAVAELGWSGEPDGDPDSPSSLVFTDRSIYRPQQKVLWKVLAYGGKRERGQLKPLPSTSMTVTLIDPNGEEVGRATVSTNGYGTAAGEFPIPAGRPLGGWSVQTSLQGGAGIQVEEYKRPTFEVLLQEPKEPLRLNRPATFAGEVRYYFGLPVTGGRVGWQVTREPVYPWWWGWWGWSRGPGRGGSNERVASGEATLGADGTFQVEFTPQADERESKDVSYRYRVSVEVTDEGGETREAEKSYRVGFAAVEARIELGTGFLEAGKPAKATVVRTDLNGGGRAGAGRFRVLELAQPAEPLLPSEEPIPQPPGENPGAAGGLKTPGDLLRPRWEQGANAERTMFGWEDGREVAAGTVMHGADGRGEVVLPPLAPGAYRLRYETEDEFGAVAKAQAEWVVAGASGEAPVEVAALLQVEQSTLRVGETARLLVHSGFAGQSLLLETYQSGELRERRRLVAGRDRGLIEIPITERHRGGLAVRLTLLRDHQTVVVERTITVPWDNQALAVDFSTFRDRIRPGTRETWRVTVRGGGVGERERAPVEAAELLAYMYDRSLDLFAPHQPPVPLQLFPARALLGPAGLSLGARHADHVAENDFVSLPEGLDLRPDRLLFMEGMGYGFGRGVRGGVVGGMVAESIMMSKSQAMEVPASATASPPAPPAARDASANGVADQEGLQQTPAAPPALRSNFAETAFWQPHLLTSADGTAAIEFTVPDSVTSWSVWVHALTKDLRSGQAERETRSVKELLVRPYLPRFLREGDRAELRVVVNNAGEQPLSGQLEIEILDTEDESSQLAAFGLAPERARQPFTVEPGGGSTVTFPLTAPKRIGTVAFKITGQAGAWSDGELRALPILPGRLHLAQSRFAALRGKETRELVFEDLAAADDPSRVTEQMVVTLDAQLFYGVLDALPYLVNYPYECTEQTLNRFVSTGIVRSLFDRYPAVGKMAAEMAKRETRYQAWIPDDPNRKMALEETPWLQSARGNDPGAEDQDLIKVLDPKIAGAQRDSALASLQEAQLPSGAFPWFPGGPPSDYMTAYLLWGFAKAAEFEVEVPREMVLQGWNYLGQRYRAEWSKEIGKKDGCCVELLTLLNYVASAYPDPSWMGEALPVAERKRILDWSFAHWKTFPPYLKGLLALTLNRMDRRADALLVFDSVMDSAKTTRDEGTFWVPEDRSWLWYNDTIEGHAFALRALLELRPDDARTAGLVQWLFLNKKLGHWRSTRSTAEVLYALAVYLERAGQLGTREAASIQVANRTTRFVFEPDRYTGRNNQVVVPGAVVDAERADTVTVVQETEGLMFASATWHFATDQLPKEARGDLFQVERRYFRRLRGGTEVRLEPIAEGAVLAPGDEVEVQLSLRSRAQAEYVHLRDPRAAGLEPGVAVSGYRYDLGIGWYEETRDSGANFFFEWLPAGEYTLKYRLRANLAGEFRVGPAQVQSMYAPEFVAYSAGNVVRVKGE